MQMKEAQVCWGCRWDPSAASSSLTLTACFPWCCLTVAIITVLSAQWQPSRSLSLFLCWMLARPVCSQPALNNDRRGRGSLSPPLLLSGTVQRTDGRPVLLPAFISASPSLVSVPSSLLGRSSSSPPPPCAPPRGSCCGTVVSDRRTHWRKVVCISLIGWLAQTQRVDSNLTSHSWILSIVTIATGILGGSGGLLIMLWDFRTLCIIIRFVTAAIRMQVSIACNMGGGGGGGGASEHQLKERRAAANTSSAPICQVKVRAEPSERNTLLGHAHMKEALGRYSNMKYRWGSESDTKRWSCDPTGAERDSGSCFCVCVCARGRSVRTNNNEHSKPIRDIDPPPTWYWFHIADWCVW